MKLRKIILGASALALAACSGDGDAVEAALSDMKLYTLDCGSIIMPANPLDNTDSFSGEELRYLPVPCYLIRHPDGDVMWDAGLPDAFHKEPQISLSLRSWVERPMEDQLKEIGVPPEDVEYLAVSHSHFDHAGNAPLFSNAKWIVMQEELDFSGSEFAQSLGFVMDMQNSPTEKIIIDDDYDVFGDGRVKVITTPGHTAGHLSLYLELPNSGKFLFTGDLYHFEESREKQLVPDFNFNEEQTRASMVKFEQVADETGARVIIQHIRKDFEAFPRFPEYVD